MASVFVTVPAKDLFFQHLYVFRIVAGLHLFMVKLSLSGSFLVHELFLFLPGLILLFLIFILFSLMSCLSQISQQIFMEHRLWARQYFLGAMTIVVKITKPLLS